MLRIDTESGNHSTLLCWGCSSRPSSEVKWSRQPASFIDHSGSGSPRNLDLYLHPSDIGRGSGTDNWEIGSWEQGHNHNLSLYQDTLLLFSRGLFEVLYIILFKKVARQTENMIDTAFKILSKFCSPPPYSFSSPLIFFSLSQKRLEMLWLVFLF